MSPSPDDDLNENEVVQELLPLDEAYLDLEVEYQKKVVELQQDYEKRQHKLLQERASILRRGIEDYGTPRLPAFWLTALKNNPCVNERIYDWDEEVLKYLEDITCEQLPDDTGLDNAGFRLVFTFSENPYFSNEKLAKEYHTKLVSHWTGDIEVMHIDSDVIEWKEGQDVTVEVVKKKSKSGRKRGGPGGGVKHVKESRPSFFRAFFRNLRKGEEPPKDLVQIMREEDDEEEMSDEEDEDLMEMIIDDDYDKGSAMRQQIIPYAVRWYTGEATPEDEEDEEDEEDDEDDEDESEDYPDTESSPEVKKQKGKKNLFASDPAEGGPKGEKEPECNQQ